MPWMKLILPNSHCMWQQRPHISMQTFQQECEHWNDGSYSCRHLLSALLYPGLCQPETEVLTIKEWVLSDVWRRQSQLQSRHWRCNSLREKSQVKQSSVALVIADKLKTTTAKYPIRRTDLKSFSVPAGALSISQANVFTGQLPDRVIITVVDNDAFNGSYTKSPYNFKNYDLNFLGVSADGIQVPQKPL